MSRPTEDELIATYFAPMAGEGGLSLKDDAAVVATTPGTELVLTVDALVAGIHFFPDDPPASIARKALGVNLSDLAAKGAKPRGFLLALALPSDWRTDWLSAFAAELGAAATHGQCPLLGGDTVRTSGPLMLSVTAFGEVPRGRMVARTGAKPGDRLYVSGAIGDAALGLALRREERAQAETRAEPQTPESLFLIDRYLHPQPRAALADALVRHANGAMDVSDGLVGDVTKLLRASSATGRVDLARVPLSGPARAIVDRQAGAFAIVVTGGDDYEILASVPPLEAPAFERAAAAAGVTVTEIGTVEAGSGEPVFRDGQGRAVTFPKQSFSHF